MTSDIIYYDEIDSPVGTLRLVADRAGLREIWFERERHPKHAQANWIRAEALLRFARVQLDEYFAGKRQHFELPLHPIGTPFQLEVWEELRRIPYGATISYGELARRIGKAQAMRAVGAANGRNPLPIVVPCHRVIGADGSLTGFGGGLPTKRYLLGLEQALPAGDLFAMPTR
ncbi:MAG: methylated-DNA--[protein]-cysteine S-methyltransferase [Rhodanobacter sp.]|nr:MAG: methylated-DNA--[protein]-cysteine S-methyltransferase [Rhodanobacter sp.]TAM04740.1 MAG: methylated-DNA--[protein]-cysteine S-methyltransferase [Rhodanobacter sp.]TAM43115.1 MAG: methylated-DNA--[protein]-cysteine S-methyltransferase [Rhodanobacter sp.]TAN28824.1 MAG: methylated-DNA--[protein]-cysteine S-methyltransferase [Rhodanobacter sp.]